MTYEIVPLRAFMKTMPEHRVKRILSRFSCSKDEDVQRYLQETSVKHESRQISRTYLLFDNEPTKRLVAYITIAISSLSVDKEQCDAELLEKMNVNRGMAQSFLIGQLGKIDGYDKKIGNIAIDHAIGLIEGANKVVGCPVIRLDCKDALVDYYKEKGFMFLNKGSRGLNQMIKILG